MRFSAVELLRFFFKPVEFYLELADFPIQAVFLRRRLRHARWRLRREHPREALQQFLLPLAHLYRVHLVLRRYRVYRLDALQGLQSNFRFELRVMLASFRGNLRDRISGLDLTIRPVQFPGTTSNTVNSRARTHPKYLAVGAPGQCTSEEFHRIHYAASLVAA